jgi:tellurium resistance protein TerZ
VSVLGPGDDLALTATRLRMGIGWDADAGAGAAGFRRAIDLDATAVQFAGGKLFDLAFFGNLATRDGSVVHLGDNRTGSGDGDDESITVDLDRVHGPVDTILFLVSSYQGHSLQWIRNAYCTLVDRGADDAAAPTGETELARFTLTLGVPDTGLVMAKLVRAGGWHLQAVGEAVSITKPSEGLERLARFL